MQIIRATRRCSKQRGEPDMAVAGIVVDHREAARAPVDQRVDQLGGRARLAEPADRHRRAVRDVGDRLGNVRDPLVDHRRILGNGPRPVHTPPG